MCRSKAAKIVLVGYIKCHMYSFILTLIVLALVEIQVASFSTTKWPRSRTTWIRLSDGLNKGAMTSLSNFKEQLTSPNDLLVERIASWQGDGVYKRLSVSDAMKISGMKQEEVRRDLMLLSTLTSGTIEVDDTGELIYAFPNDFVAVLRQRNLGSKLKQMRKKYTPAVMYVTRVGFGLLLLTSLAAIASAFVAASSGSNDKEDREDTRGGRRQSAGLTLNFGGGRRYGYGGYSSMDFLFDFFYPRPYSYYYYERDRKGAADGVSLLESFFSFVFGDGDPNHDFDSRRMQTIAEYIRDKDGIVVAEELAPFMDPHLPPLSVAELRQGESPEARLALSKAKRAQESTVVDESWVLPAVLQFGGMPQVTGNGNIYYRFDALRKSMSAASASATREASPSLVDKSTMDEGDDGPALWMKERTIPFSRALPSQRVLAGALGCLNFAGVQWLGRFLRMNGLRMPGLYPLMMGYALLYVSIPMYRALRLQRRNTAIVSNNSNREMWATFVQQMRDTQFKEKLADVAQHSEQNKPRDDGPRQVIYTTEVETKGG